MSLRLFARFDDPVAERIRNVVARMASESWLVVGESEGVARLGDVDLPEDAPDWLVEAAVLRALRPGHIAFLCVANSARSQLGEGLGLLMAPEGVRVSSAGSEPTTVRPQAVAVLQEIGVDISGHWSKLTDDLERPVDAVITLCAEENCPVWLEKAWRLHWPLPDPAGVEGSEEEVLDAFRGVRDELRRRLGVLFQGSGGTSAGS